MKGIVTRARRVLALGAVGVLPALLAPGTASAGTAGTITFGRVDGVHAVPTLGGTMLVLLAILFAFVALRVLHRRHGGGGMASLVAGVLAAGALAAGGGGITLLGDAWAASVVSVTDSVLDQEPSGRAVFGLSDPTLSDYKNDSSTLIEVLSFEPAAHCSDNSSTCQEGTSLSVGESCTVDVGCDTR